MITRYSRKTISQIWSNENKFKIWTEIECLIAEKLSLNGTIPKNASKEIRKKAKFNVKEIDGLLDILNRADLSKYAKSNPKKNICDNDLKAGKNFIINTTSSWKVLKK